MSSLFGISQATSSSPDTAIRPCVAAHSPTSPKTLIPTASSSSCSNPPTWQPLFPTAFALQNSRLLEQSHAIPVRVHKGNRTPTATGKTQEWVGRKTTARQRLLRKHRWTKLRSVDSGLPILNRKPETHKRLITIRVTQPYPNSQPIAADPVDTLDMLRISPNIPLMTNT